MLTQDIINYSFAFIMLKQFSIVERTTQTCKYRDIHGLDLAALL